MLNKNNIFNEIFEIHINRFYYYYYYYVKLIAYSQ